MEVIDKVAQEFDDWYNAVGVWRDASRQDLWLAWKVSRKALFVEPPKPKLMKTDDYHEDYGAVIFIGWDRNSDGSIAGAPPSLYFGCGWLDEGFDSDLYTHWIEAKFFNSLFTQADPDSFPEM
ncbi:MAG: hypothetical protein ACRDC4_04835 [Plesiomonas sp.]